MVSKVSTLRPVVIEEEVLLADYTAYLRRSPLAEASRTAYRRRVSGFLRWLAVHPEHGMAALSEPLAREHALRDYLRHLRVELRRPPTTCNAHLAAINNLCTWLGLGHAQMKAARLPQAAPRALDEAQVRRLLRVAERRSSPRDEAILITLMATGLRLAELAALDVPDVQLSARKGLLAVRNGKGGRSRSVPLNSQARVALQHWLDARAPSASPALFTGPRGDRLGPRAVDLVLRRIARDAEIDMSAHTLRHTAATRLVRGGVDLVLVAEVLGHASLETTRRYSLPTEEDRAAALETLIVDR